ncbi:hypothetical protein ACIO6U_02865 [Streptomyces sp. NPDC087422]|uniref:hypothetical protein n=1 Tax=Streptomyces sp. NPDC087422 TaxID=3365786 RepID=UPI00382C9AAA
MTTSATTAQPPQGPTPTCANAWCPRPRRCKGYCNACYQRAWRTGDPERATVLHTPYGVSRTDIDEAAVQRIVDGDAPEHTTVGERDEAVRRLHACGLNDVEIASRIGHSVSMALRARTRLKLPANQRGPRRLAEAYFTDHLTRSRMNARRGA